MERVSRRRLLTAGGSAALASAVVGSGVAAAQTTLPPGRPLMSWLERYVIVTDTSRVDTARQAAQGAGLPTGPAYFTGAVYRERDVSGGTPSGNAVGTYRLAGWVYSGGAVPLIVGVGSFDFFGRGKLTTAGVGGPVGSLGVVGGTGEFMQVGGEARTAYVTPGNVGVLLVEFELLPQSMGQ